MTKLYMAVTKDEYELPLAVADTSAELAAMVGLKAQSVRKAASKSRRNGTNTGFVCIECENMDMAAKAKYTGGKHLKIRREFVYTIVCQQCKAEETVLSTDQYFCKCNTPSKYFRSRGWRDVDGRTLCYECVQEEREKKFREETEVCAR